jgi:hypothetical protein
VQRLSCPTLPSVSEFNEALVHQVVVRLIWLAVVKAAKLRNHVQTFLAVAKSHSVKKVLVALVLVLFVAQSGWWW